MAEASVGLDLASKSDDLDLGLENDGGNVGADFDFDIVDNGNEDLVQPRDSPFEDPVVETAVEEEAPDQVLLSGDGFDIGAANIAENDTDGLGAAAFDLDEIDYNLGEESTAAFGFDAEQSATYENRQSMQLDGFEEGGGEEAVGATDAARDDLDEITYDDHLGSVDNSGEESGKAGEPKTLEDQSIDPLGDTYAADDKTGDAADWEFEYDPENATATPRAAYSSPENGSNDADDDNAEESSSDKQTSTRSRLDLGFDRAGLLLEGDDHQVEGKAPDVTVVYAGTEYPLFGNPDTDDPDQYFFEDLAIMRYPLSRFLDSIRGVITEWISDDEEVRIFVHGLNIEFGETTTDALLKQVTFHQLLSLHSTLCRNDDSDSSSALRFTVRPGNHCALRIKKLVDCASQGKGYGYLESEDAPNQSSGDGTEMEGISQDASPQEDSDDEAEDSSEEAASSNDQDQGVEQFDMEEGDATNGSSHSADDEEENVNDPYGATTTTGEDIADQDIADEDQADMGIFADFGTGDEDLLEADTGDNVPSGFDQTLFEADSAPQTAPEELFTNMSPDGSAENTSLADNDRNAPTEDRPDIKPEEQREIADSERADLATSADEQGLDADGNDQDQADLAYSYLDLGDTAESHLEHGEDAVQPSVDDDDYLDLGDADEEPLANDGQYLDLSQNDGNPTGEQYLEAATSATATLDGDEIDYEDHGISGQSAPTTEPGPLESSTASHAQDRPVEVDEIDWDDGDKAAAFDNELPTPQSITGKRTREMDETDALVDEHGVKRQRA